MPLVGKGAGGLGSSRPSKPVVLILGILWDPILLASQKGVNRFQNMPQPTSGPVAAATKAGCL